MEREEEKRMIRQSDEVHGIICGKEGQPGLCEDVRQLERRVGRIEGGAKWVLGVFTALFLSGWGLVWGFITKGKGQ